MGASEFDDVVLTYPHPHVVTFLQDNTVYTETFLEAESPVIGIQFGTFSQGRDNELLLCNTLTEFIEEFGTPNYDLYGQAAYNIVNALNTGYCSMYVMRVMPDNATHANTVIMVRYKVVKNEPETPEPPIDNESGGAEGISLFSEFQESDLYEVVTNPNEPDISEETENIEGERLGGTLHLSFYAVKLSGATSVKEIELKLAEMYTPDPDDEGYIHQPLFCFYQRGRGVFGHNTRLRFADASNYDDPDSLYRKYRLDVMHKGETLVRKESIEGTLNEDLFDVDTKESLYLQDLVMDPETGSSRIGLIIQSHILEDLLDLYNTEVAKSYDEEYAIDTIDFLFGKAFDGTTNPNIVFDEISNAINLNSVDGFRLYNGNDGDFTYVKDKKNPTGGGSAIGSNSLKRQIAIDECLVRGIRGEFDKTVLSRFTSHADFMLDACFSDEVKRALIQLAVKREYDAMTYIDTGLLTSVDDTIKWLEDYSLLTGHNVVKELHHYKIRDIKYTGKTIPVTITYFIAGNLPTHIKTIGIGEPFARDNAVVREAVKGSFLPVIDPVDNDIKKEIYLLRGNCYETVKYNVYRRSTAITSQLELSDRLDEFNEYIIHLAVKTCEDILYGKIYKSGEPDAINLYQEEATRVLNFTLGKLVNNISVTFKMSATDKIRSILRLELRIVFKTIVKRGIVEIYLDPRA